jgi:hypothetical protein
MNQLLNYLATYPNNGTTYRASDMILCTHTDAGFHNESKGRSQAGTQFFVSKNSTFPKHNGLVLSISQIMKIVMSSAAKAKLGALYTAKKLPPSIKPSSKWVGHNHACPSKLTTPLQLASPTSPSSCKKPSPWTSAYGGSTAKNLNNSFPTTGIRAVTIGQTITPSTTHPSTTKQSQETHPCRCSRPTTLNCCLIQAPLRFPTNKPTITPVFFFFSLSEQILGCHCKGVLIAYYLHTVRAFTKLVTLLQLTSLLRIHLLHYLGASRHT